MSKRRILITGGAGFIGCHLADQLSQESENELVIIDNFSRGRLDREMNDLRNRSNVQLISADLTDAATYNQLGEGYDEVYHLAAIIGVRNVLQEPDKVLHVNAIATLNLLNWFVRDGGKKLFFSSTSEAYAWTQQFYTLPIPTSEDVPLALTELGNPRITYAGSKIFGELAVTQYCLVHQKPFVIVRYHNVYGPRMGTEHVIPELYWRALNGQNPLDVYSANHSRAFCYVSDAITATIRSMRVRVAENQVFHIGNDREEIQIGDLARRILDRANISVEIQCRAATNDPIIRRCPNISRARALLDYEPRVTLDEGLARTLKWYARELVHDAHSKQLSD